MAREQEQPQVPEGTVSLTFDQLKELLAQTRMSEDEQARLIRLQADENAKANRRALRPENERHPGVSVYNPSGGTWPKPKCKLIWIAEPVDQDHQSTVEEIELFNELQPGDYTCTRSDGTKMRVKVSAERSDIDNSILKLTVWFDTRDHLRHNLPPKTAMLREMLAQQKERQLVTV